MPPHWLQAGPRSRPWSLAGTTGGLSVRALGGATLAALDAADASGPAVSEEITDCAASCGPPLPGPGPPDASGPAVSEEITDCAASCASLRARTAGVRMPSSSCASVLRKRLASQ